MIAVMGGTGAGKSTFISLLTDEDVSVGHSLQSCTVPQCSVPFSVTYYDAGTTEVGLYEINYGKERSVYLLDTPGFDDTNRPDSEILQEIALYLAALYANKIRLAGLVYLHRITDTRVSGSSLKNFRVFQNLCGAGASHRAVLCTTMWSTLESLEGGREIGLQRCEELKRAEFWGEMIRNKSTMKEHNGSKASALSIIAELVDREGGVVLDIQRQMVDDNLSLDDTDAGRYLHKDLIEARERYEKEIAELTKNLEEAIAEKDAEAVDMINQEKEAAESRVEVLQNNSNQLKVSLKQIAAHEQTNSLSRDSDHKDLLATISGPVVGNNSKALEEEISQVEQKLDEYRTKHQKYIDHQRRIDEQTAIKIASLEEKLKELQEQYAREFHKKKQRKSTKKKGTLRRIVKNWISSYPKRKITIKNVAVNRDKRSLR